jgi:hypothetical protein
MNPFDEKPAAMHTPDDKRINWMEAMKQILLQGNAKFIQCKIVT